MSERSRILLVEDNEDLRWLGMMILSDDSMEVLEAGNGNEALEVLSNLEPEGVKVILTDLQMPGMGGIELIKRLRADERWKDVPVVVMTATPGDLAGSGLEEAGLRVMAKPFRSGELVRVVREVLGEKGQNEAGLME